MKKIIELGTRLWDFLQGKKIHLSMVFAASIILAEYFKLINADQYTLLMKLDAAFFGIGFRSFAQKIVDSLNEFSATEITSVPAFTTVTTTGKTDTPITINVSGTSATPTEFTKVVQNQGEMGS